MVAPRPALPDRAFCALSRSPRTTGTGRGPLSLSQDPAQDPGLYFLRLTFTGISLSALGRPASAVFQIHQGTDSACRVPNAVFAVVPGDR